LVIKSEREDAITCQAIFVSETREASIVTESKKAAECCDPEGALRVFQ
jgi:hypothetical protein